MSRFKVRQLIQDSFGLVLPCSSLSSCSPLASSSCLVIPWASTRVDHSACNKLPRILKMSGSGPSHPTLAFTSLSAVRLMHVFAARQSKRMRACRFRRPIQPMLPMYGQWQEKTRRIQVRVDAVISRPIASPLSMVHHQSVPRQVQFLCLHSLPSLPCLLWLPSLPSLL